MLIDEDGFPVYPDATNQKIFGQCLSEMDRRLKQYTHLQKLELVFFVGYAGRRAEV